MSNEITTKPVATIAPPAEYNPRRALGIIAAGGSTAIAPTSMQEAIEFAKLMSQSGPCIRPQFRGNPGACLAVSLQAWKWGFDPISVSNKAYFTKSKSGDEQLAYEAQLIAAVVNERAPLASKLRPTYTGDGPTKRCHIKAKVIGEEGTFDYDSPEFQRIGVKNSPLWSSDPEQQFWYYSVRAWARRHFPEILLGVSTPDEIDAQAEYYGRPRPVDAPTRPQLSDFEAPALEHQPQSKATFTFSTADGELAEFASADDAVDAMDVAMKAALAINIDAVEGVWDSNALLVTQLRERDRGDLADWLKANYVHYMGPAPTPKEDEAAKDETKPAQPAQKEIAQPALPSMPSTPFAAKKGQIEAAWLAWEKTASERIQQMPQAEISDFLSEHTKEFDFMAEQRKGSWEMINALIERRKEAA